MNREILFKAKTIDNGEWVEGYYVYDYSHDAHYIFANIIVTPNGVHDRRESFSLEYYEINPNTLCQYTGLTDTNDREIWENSILELPGEDGYFKCEWEEDTARFVLNGDGLTVDFDNYWSYQVEVVGNIFDNPELLEVEE